MTFGCVLALFILTVLISFLSLVSTADNFTAFYQTPFHVTNMAGDLRANIQEFAKLIGYSTMVSDEQQTASYIQSAKDVLQELRDGTTQMRESFPEASSIIDEYDSLMKGIMERRDMVLELASVNKNEEAAQIYFSEVMPVFVKANQRPGILWRAGTLSGRDGTGQLGGRAGGDDQRDFKPGKGNGAIHAAGGGRGKADCNDS